MSNIFLSCKLFVKRAKNFKLFYQPKNEKLLSPARICILVLNDLICNYNCVYVNVRSKFLSVRLFLTACQGEYLLPWFFCKILTYVNKKL